MVWYTGITCTIRTHERLKRAPLFEKKLEQAALTRHVTAPTYISTLFALLLPPPVNVSGCLVRERELEGIKYGTGGILILVVQFEHTNV